MSISLSKLPWLGIGLALVVTSVLGALWFMVLFKKQYLFTLGRSANDPPSKDPIYFLGPMGCSFVVILTSAILMDLLNITTYGAAFTFALLVGFGYLVANTVNIGINPNIPRPIQYGMLSGAYHMVSLVLVAMVLIALK